MPFDIDFAGVGIKNVSQVVVPPGTHNLSIVKATEKFTKKGDPMVVVDYEIVDGDYIGKLIKNHCVVFFKDKESPGAGIAGVKKIETSIGKMAIRNYPVIKIECGEDEIPIAYKKIEVKEVVSVDKAALKKAIKSGESISGVALADNLKLSIK